MELPSINVLKYRANIQELASKAVLISPSGSSYNVLIDLERLTGNLGKYFKMIGMLRSTSLSFTYKTKIILIGKELNSDMSFWIERNFQLLRNTLNSSFPNYEVNMAYSRGGGPASLNLQFKMSSRDGQDLQTMKSGIESYVEMFLSVLLDELEEIQSKTMPIMSKFYSITDEYDVPLLKVGLNWYEEDVEKIFILNGENNFSEKAINEFKAQLNTHLEKYNISYKECKLVASFERMNNYYSITSKLNSLMNTLLINDSDHPCLKVNDEDSVLTVNGDKYDFFIGTGNISLTRLLSIAKKAKKEDLMREFTNFVCELEEIKD